MDRRCFALVEGFNAAMRAARVGPLDPATAHRPDYGPVRALLPAALPDFSGNGVVAVVDGAVLIRVSRPSTSVEVTLEITAAAPPVDTRGWDEVVEVSWTATRGLGTVLGSVAVLPAAVAVQTPPWPGPYRVRVHAAGRDGDGPVPERYRLLVWPAPTAPDTMYTTTDALGRRLRGEPDPPRPERPVTTDDLGDGGPATITVVTGAATPAEVLAAFGADPDRPLGLEEIHADAAYGELIMLHALGDVVLTVEPNGYRGTDTTVLQRLSRLRPGGRAASWFWNVNGLTCLSLARDGIVLADFEPGLEAPPDDAEVTAILAGIDFDGGRGDGEVVRVIERFTGFRVHPDDYERVLRTETAYRAPCPG